MILEAAAAAWLYAQHTSQDCFIFGEVSAAADQAPDLKATGCPIKIERKGNLITLTSPKFVVEIALPDMAGPQKFLYQWGQAEATIGNQVIAISYREVGGG